MQYLDVCISTLVVRSSVIASARGNKKKGRVKHGVFVGIKFIKNEEGH